MRVARAAAFALALAAVAAATGCDLVFPPGKLGGDARPGGDGAGPDATPPPPGVCDPMPFDPRRYSAAWQSMDMMPWNTAASLCKVRGWDLATINDVSEAGQLGSLYLGADHWIGLADRGDEVWQSVDGCPDPGAWDEGQPDFPSEDCAGLDGATFRLHSFPCTGSASSPDSMICEQPRPPTLECLSDAVRAYDPANYTNVGSSGTYADARTMCDALGQHVVVIDTPDESEAVAILAGGINYWVGATDAGHEGTWETETGCPGYLQWNAGEPSDVGSVANCASGIGSGYLDDVDCTAVKEVICEAPRP